MALKLSNFFVWELRAKYHIYHYTKEWKCCLPTWYRKDSTMSTANHFWQCCSMKGVRTCILKNPSVQTHKLQNYIPPSI